MRVNFKYTVFTLPWWISYPLVLLLVGFVLLYARLTNVLNPDMVAYFAIARHYQNGDFITAFNSYWSPLICWIMAILPGIKSDPLFVFRIINILIGLLLFVQLQTWIRILLVETWNRFWVNILIVFLILHYSLYTGTPDFLSVYCFYVFFTSLFRSSNTFSKGIGVGITILLSFFSKSFLLPMCLVFVGLVELALLWKKKNIRWKFIAAMITIVSIGLVIWGWCLKLHYGEFLLSSSFAFNSTFDICEQFVVVDLPYPSAIFMWEDPYYLHVKAAYFWDSAKHFELYCERWISNLTVTRYLLGYFSYWGIFILLLPLAGFVWKSTSQLRLNKWMWLVMMINWFGYFLVLLLERYLTIGHFALCISVFGFAEIGLTKIHFLKKYSALLRYAIPVVLFLSLVKNPVIENWHEQLKVDYMKLQYSSAQKMGEYTWLNGKKLAAFSNSTNLYDYIGFTCYFSGAHYLGETKMELSDVQQQEELKKHSVQILVHDKSKPLPLWAQSLMILHHDAAMNVLYLKLE